jgi:DNA-binding beta-propeller fold protein YncE
VSPRGRAAAALLAAAALAAVAAAPASASRGCPQAALHPQPAPRDIAHPPKRAILACVGARPITGAQLAHWIAIEHRQLRTFSRSSLTGIALAELVAFAAVEGEAREHHIVVTARDVRRAFRHRLRTRFRQPGSFRRSLRFEGESRADFLAEVRRDLLIAAIRRRESLAERARINAKWHARTTCARAVADGDECGLIAPFAAGPPAVGIAGGFDGLAVDPVSDTLYVSHEDGLKLIDGRTCNASTTSGCTDIREAGFRDADLRGIAIDATTDTVYVAQAETDSVLVLDGRTCNATITSGCYSGAVVRLARDGVPEQPVVDPATHTLYVRSNAHVVYVIDTSRCNGSDHSGCGNAPARLRTADELPRAIAVSPATSTLYIVNEDTKTVSVADTRRCSALDASGCGARWPAIAFAWAPLTIAINPPTGALYVTTDDDAIHAIDGAACNATAMTGCQAQRSVKLRESGRAIAIDAPTHTAYVTGRFLGGVSLLDTATCNAAVSTGCARTPPVARTGREPDEIAIDERTRTVYVANGEERSVSLIRADSCNASTAAGC